MAPKRDKSGKSKATSKPEVVFNRLRFHTYANEQTFETLIRELYSNLSVDEDICHGHKLTSWIRGVCFTITRDDVSNALYVPIICRPTYPCSKSPRIDDVMDVLYGRSVHRGSDPSISSSELTKLNYIFFRIACHSIFPISHVHKIPTNRCFFLYALVTNSSICFCNSPKKKINK